MNGPSSIYSLPFQRLTLFSIPVAYQTYVGDTLASGCEPRVRRDPPSSSTDLRGWPNTKTRRHPSTLLEPGESCERSHAVANYGFASCTAPRRIEVPRPRKRQDRSRFNRKPHEAHVFAVTPSTSQPYDYGSTIRRSGYQMKDNTTHLPLIHNSSTIRREG